MFKTIRVFPREKLFSLNLSDSIVLDIKTHY